jgi:hypothetical protein
LDEDNYSLTFAVGQDLLSFEISKHGEAWRIDEVEVDGKGG